ncbi:MAG: hypothetical protein ABIR63_00560 [Sphingomicrobium sp.]
MRKIAPAPHRLRDFRSYGRLEAFNAVLVPGVATYFGWPRDLAGGAVLLLANLGVVIGLIVGALYWLAVAARIERNSSPMNRAMKIAAAAQRPMLVIVASAAIGDLALIAVRGWSMSTSVAALVILLAGLEYINYYHVQLQHFDHRADWRRLLEGRGFRQAHMARALASWRRGS